MTQENSGDQAVRQQCDNTVDVTVGVGDGAGGLFVHGSLEAVKRVQAAFDEVRRLREERAELVAYGDGWKQQWEEMRDTMWKPAMDMLARVNALPAKWSEASYSSDHLACLRELEAALAD